MNEIKLLECTLRDGSYAIDFQFTAEDTMVIAAALEDAGFKYIEIGHGLGFNASNAGKGVAASTDWKYLEAAKTVLKKAKYGMFFIPGIGRAEDLERSIEYGMDFVRIGTNVTEAEQAEKYIKLAKDLGLITTSNLMKSYALPPDKFIAKAKLVEKWGADIVYFVDSAGGMFPKDIKTYLSKLRNSIGVEIGFHGHNNLSLGIANAIEALNCGATFLDSTLQGIGRSAGNVQTEILVSVLQKMGYKLNIDQIETMDIGEKYIKPRLRKIGIDSIDVTAGYALFHSSFLKTVEKIAKKYGLDVRSLIIKTAENSVVNAPEEIIETIAKNLIINPKNP